MRSSTGICTMAMPSRIPQAEPMTKPTRISVNVTAERVQISAARSRPARARPRSPTAPETHRAERRSSGCRPRCISSRIANDSSRSRTRHAHATRPARRWPRPLAVSVVAMSAIGSLDRLCGAGEVEASPDFGGQLGQRRRQQVGEAARSRLPRLSNMRHDAAWPRRHHRDAVREEHRLADRMGDEHHGLAAVHPDALQFASPSARG